MKQGIYTASKTKHAHLWRALRAQGLPVVSTWIDEAGVGETQSFPDLWSRCIREASTAAALILYVEEGEVLKGALVEVGAALASGTRVLVVGRQPGFTFTAHPLVVDCGSLDEAVERATLLCAHPEFTEPL